MDVGEAPPGPQAGAGAPNPQQQPGVRLVNGSGRHVKYLDIILRLPFLFLMDRLLLNEMGTGLVSRLNISSYEGKTDIVLRLSKQRDDCHVDPLLTQFLYTAMPQHYLPPYRRNVCLGIHPTLEEIEAAFSEHFGNPDWKAVPLFLDALLAFTVYLLSLFILINSTTSHLINLCGYVTSTVLVGLSYVINSHIIDEVIKEDGGQLAGGWLTGPGPLILVNYVCQSLIGFTSSKMLKMHWNDNAHWLVYNVIMHSALVPSALAVYGGLSGQWLRVSVVICAIPQAIIVFVTLSQSFGQLVRSFVTGVKAKLRSIRDIGLNTFLELEWSRLQVPSLLRTFWVVRLVQQLTVSLGTLALSAGFDEHWNLVVPPLPSLNQVLSHTVNLSKEMLSGGNETLLAVLGATSMVAKVCHYIGSFFHHYLMATDLTAAGEVAAAAAAAGGGGVVDAEERSVASVCAIVFFVLALQTGLTSLNPDKRLTRLYQNLCLLVTAIFHFIHNMVSSHLIALGASGSAGINYRKHLRALSVCLFLTVAPLGLLVCLWKWFSMGTFLLAVTVFCVEVVIKVAVTVSVYGLLIYDARVRKGTWEELDDAVYFVKAAGNTVEFLCAVLLLLNGAWILFFESGGLIRAIMMLIHAYCNIWCEARNGWKNLVKRRSAVAKINRLHDATSDEVARYADVCSICYQDMDAAKRTGCGHMFHAMCLRKWLYIQDTCPLCHAGLVEQRQSRSTNTGEDDFDDVIDNDRVIEEDQDDDDDDDDGDTDVLAVEESEDDSDLFYDSMEEYRREAASSSLEQLPRMRQRRRRQQTSAASSSSSAAMHLRTSSDSRESDEDGL